MMETACATWLCLTCVSKVAHGICCVLLFTVRRDNKNLEPFPDHVTSSEEEIPSKLNFTESLLDL